MNGGTCQRIGSHSYACLCHTGYSGINCQTSAKNPINKVVDKDRKIVTDAKKATPITKMKSLVPIITVTKLSKVYDETTQSQIMSAASCSKASFYFYLFLSTLLALVRQY